MKPALLLCTLLPGLLLLDCKHESIPPLPLFTDIVPDKGGPGNTVRISGSQFGVVPSDATVRFHGVDALITDIEDTAITVIVPANATTGMVDVTIKNRLALGAHVFTILPGKWTQVANLPGDQGLVQGVGFAVNGKGYYATGFDGGAPRKELYEYDPTTNQWATKAPLPDHGEDQGMYEAVALTIGTKAYVGIGRRLGVNTNEWWEYDPANNTWTEKTPLPGALRHSAAGESIGNRGIVVGGWSSSGEYLKDCWQYDATHDQWNSRAVFPGDGVLYPACFVIDSSLYLNPGDFVPTRKWYKYNAPSDTWTSIADGPDKIQFGATGFAAGGKGYVAGGGSECWQYNPQTNTWSQVAFIGQRVSGSTFVINGAAYYVGGSGPDNLQLTVWKFTPP